jgi:hypothetical protein
MKFCEYCGEELAVDAHFCHKCGKAVQSAEQPQLTRAEIYKNREAESVEIDELASEENDETKPVEETTSRRANAHTENQVDWQKQLKIYGMWIKNNPWTALLILVIMILIFSLLSKAVGSFLFLVAVVCGYFYAVKVGPEDTTADTKLKAGINRLKKMIEKVFQQRPKKQVAVPNEQTETQQPIAETEPEVTTSPVEVPQKTKRSVWYKLLLIVTIVLIASTYVGPFASAATAGFGTKVTLYSILKTLGQLKMLWGLLIGPGLLLLGALIKSRWMIKTGGLVNFLAYLFTFFLIYQNEAQSAGFNNMFNNVKIGVSGYVAVAITIVILMVGGKRK